MSATDLDLAAKHKYRLLNGDIAVNVTTISGLVDDGRSGGMAYVAAKLTKQGLDYRQEWDAKRDAGTRTHGYCEEWLLGRAVDVPDDDLGFVDALEQFWREHDPIRLECEQVVLSTHGYGGRFDMVVTLKDGRTLLVDLKTGKPYPVEHSLQLSAYRYADGIAVYGETGNLSNLRPMPEVDACACLYVRGDGTYHLVEHPADRTAFEHFLRLLAVYRWMREMAQHTRVVKQLTKGAA